MQGFETIYKNKRFEVITTGRDRFFLELKGALVYAHPGLKRITRLEAEQLIAEHVIKHLENVFQASIPGKAADASASDNEKEVEYYD